MDASWLKSENCQFSDFNGYLLLLVYSFAEEYFIRVLMSEWLPHVSKNGLL